MLMPLRANTSVTSANTPVRLGATTVMRCTYVLHKCVDLFGLDSGHHDEMRDVALRGQLPFLANAGVDARKNDGGRGFVPPCGKAGIDEALLRIRRNVQRSPCAFTK